MDTKWIVVGLSGISCGGKSTLAENLQNNLPNSVIIRQDLYFHPEDSPRHIKIPELNHFNHDTMESINMENLMSDLRLVLKNYLNVPKASVKIENSEDKWRVLIIDGFIVLNYEPLRKLCDLKYQINLTKEEFWKRRALRKYKRPEVPGYLEKCVWPEYLKHNEELKKCDGIIFLDGLENRENLLNRVLDDIKLKIQTI